MEFLLALPLVLMLMAGIFEFGRHYYTRLTLRNAVAEAARFAVTGGALVDPQTGQPMTRANSILQVVVTRARDLNVDVNQIRLEPPDGGQPGQVLSIRATYRYQFVLAPVAQFFGPGFVDFTVATSVLNEPVF